MNKLKLIVALLYVMIFNYSCDNGYLDQVNYGTVNDDVLWKDKSDVQQAINSSVSFIDQRFGYYSMHFLLMEDGATDYWSGGANSAFEFSNFAQWRTNYPTVFNWAVWPPLWKSIYYSNLVLERLDRVPNLTPEEKNRLEGQARFFRAFNYYFAQNKFGGVPIITSAEDDRTAIPQSTREEVRKFVEADLIIAAKLLPGKADVKAEGLLSRPSKQAALGLLARLYINWESRPDRWQKTKEICDQIISDPSSAGLETPYSKIFALNNENNKEILYSLEHSTVSALTGTFLLNNYFNCPADNIVQTAFIGWGGNWRVTRVFYDKFNDADQRKSQMYITYTNKAGAVNRPISVTTPATALLRKYPLDALNLTSPFGGNDQPVIRYADIILMKAEAENQLGNLAVAISLINQIRIRAGLANLDNSKFTNKELLNDEIYDERRREFFLEGLGRTDMIRFKLTSNTTHANEFLREIAKKSGTNNGDAKYLLYPFDGQALIKNPGLIQNPGYTN